MHIPKLCRHSRGLGVVRLSGIDHYSTPHRWPLTHQSPPALVKQWYDALIAEWKASAGVVIRDKSPTINVVLAAFLRQAKRIYKERGPGESTELENFRHATALLVKLYGNMPAAEFSPKKLKAVRQAMVDAKLARRTVNARCRRIKQIIAWAVEEELVPGSVHHALVAVKGLRKGQTEAKESKKVKPAPIADVKATLKECRPEIQAMIRLQFLTGMRPGEVCRMTPGQVDRSRKVWIYRPVKFKTDNQEDAVREVFLGRKAQRVLTPWLLRAADKPCFLTAQNRKGFLSVYNTHNYQQYIERACERAAVDQWSPNQLRHNAGTRFRRKFGLETARVLLGHSKVETTQIYAEVDRKRALQAVKQLG
jgi:integrase